MNDHPDLRALAYGDEDTDSEDGAVLDRRGWFKKAWKKVKKFFKKVGSVLKKLWNKWKNKVIPWLVKKGKAIACSYCKSPRPTIGMGWAVFRIIKNLIKSAACAICKTGWLTYCLIKIRVAQCVCHTRTCDTSLIFRELPDFNNNFFSKHIVQVLALTKIFNSPWSA